MINFHVLKWVCYDFDDTLCIHQHHHDDPVAEYLTSLLTRGISHWDNSLKSDHMQKFMDFCADNGIQQALITASPEHLSAEMKNQWVQKNYRHTLRNFAMGTGNDKIEMLKAIAQAETIEPSNILVVDDRSATLDLAADNGFQACTPMEVVNFVENNLRKANSAR